MSDDYKRQRERRADWMRRHGLRAVPKGRQCWHRLLGSKARCPDGKPCSGFGSALGGWTDHGSLYQARDGSFCWAAQPYGLSNEQRDRIDDFAYEHSLDVQISDDAWWAPGAVLVMFTL